jgi:predicted metal-dependent enzyme (double-stranded beta helix superfamily)
MNIARLRRFIADMTSLVGGAWQDRDEAAIVEVGRTLLADLVKHDDWLPDSTAECPPHGYAQNLLWCDPFERFSVVSFVWAPSACTPVHDHQTWGLVGMLRGSETSQRFVRDPANGTLAKGGLAILAPGDVEVLLPAEGDIHQVTNARSDCGSLSIHVYGGNIGVIHRHTFDMATGQPSPFVSGYTNREMPNLWDRSAEVRSSPP